MLRVGIAGIGFMGMIHYLAYERVANAKVGAIFTRDPKKLSGDWTDIQGNFGPRGQMMDLSDVVKCDSYYALLANDDIDLIDVCPPTCTLSSRSRRSKRASTSLLRSPWR